MLDLLLICPNSEVERFADSLAAQIRAHFVNSVVAVTRPRADKGLHWLDPPDGCTQENSRARAVIVIMDCEQADADLHESIELVVRRNLSRLLVLVPGVGDADATTIGIFPRIRFSSASDQAAVNELYRCLSVITQFQSNPPVKILRCLYKLALPLGPAPVFLGAAAPRITVPGDEFTARFVAYRKEFEEVVKAVLTDLSPTSTIHLGVYDCQWSVGATVTVTLRVRGLDVDVESQTFTWDGTKAFLDFDVTVPVDAKPGTVVLKFDAFIDSVKIAGLRVDLQIVPGDAGVHAGSSPRSLAWATAARTAFASYASSDGPRVLDRVAAVRISAGLDVFVDCLSLHAGDEWRPRLEKEIMNRDLFWSQEAAESEHVTWEWQTALRERGKGAMQIHPLEVGVQPPHELADLHFSDVCILARRGFENGAHE